MKADRYGTSQQKAMPTSRACSADLTFTTAGSFPCFTICQAYKSGMRCKPSVSSFYIFLKISPNVQLVQIHFPPRADAIHHATGGFPLWPDQCSVRLCTQLREKKKTRSLAVVLYR